MKKNEFIYLEWKISGLQKVLRIMKLTVYLLLFSVISVFASKSYSQTKKLNLNMKNNTVKEVLRNIEEQSEFVFMYSQKLVDVNREVSVNVKNQKINEVLDELFAGTNVHYKIRDRFILLTTPEVFKTDLMVQQQTVSGRVTDSGGQPLPGVSIVVKGTTQGTVTNADGEYSLTNIPDDATLVFSFVGIKTQEMAVGNRTNIDVILEEEAVGIEEVVAIGYGTQKKANLTGAVSVATSERLENRPITSAGRGLQGVIPNLNVSIRNGDPAVGASYNIRGYESITGGNPLILVDGVPMNLEHINPDDIASVSVLKDAGAAAVYGARAAFGVILVTTKKGKKGKMQLSFSTEQSFAKPIFTLDPIRDPYEWITLMNMVYQRTEGRPYVDDAYTAGIKKYSENPIPENEWGVEAGELRFYGANDFQNKMITDFAPQQKYDMSITGASDKASYYVSMGYLNKDGYLRSDRNINFKQYNVLMKADFQIKDWLSLDGKIVFNSRLNDEPHTYSMHANINAAARVGPSEVIQFPDLPYYVEPGDREKYEQYIGMWLFQSSNMNAYLEDGGRTTYTTNDLWLTQGITLTPIEGLKIRGDFSYNYYFDNYKDVASKVYFVDVQLLPNPVVHHGDSGSDFIRKRMNYNQYYVFNTYAEYTFEKFKIHYLKAMVGFNQEWGQNETLSGKASQLTSPLITDIGATTGPQEIGGGLSHVSLRGVVCRLNYIYKDKYLLEANGRYDLTSRFPKEDRMGFFPSFSAGWRISNEPFMDGSRGWLDNLKVRVSYGELGNQLLGNNYYPYISSMRVGASSMILSTGKIPYVRAGDLVSPSLTWETVATKNIGLDFTILGQRLDVSADIYTRDTKDMLMNVDYPDILGTAGPDVNAADLRTKGWELSVTWRDKIGEDWKYGINIALSDNQAEITKYDNPTGALSEYYVGQKLGEIWGYVTEGIFQTEEELASHADQSRLGANWAVGDMGYTDLNGDGVIDPGNLTLDDPGDRKIIGNSSPRYSFGINPHVSYKNWTLNLFFQGLLKRDFLPQAGGWTAFYPYNTGLIEHYYVSESWSEDNRDAYFPRPVYAVNDSKSIKPQSRYVQNAAYIRLKNLTLNYNLPQELISKVGLSRAQVYFSGMNLWEYSKIHKSLDPEVVTTNQEYYRQRIFTLGIKVTL